MLTKRCLVPIPNMSRLLANTTKQLFANRFIAIRTRSKVVMRCSIGVARLSTIIPQQKRFSSLAGDNPMFPQRQLPEEDSNNEKNKKKNNNNDDSILANHGGKIALVALAFAAYLIYSFYKGSQNKEDQETLVRERTAIEPKEFVQLRANISEGLFLDDSDTEKKATISYDNALFHSVTKHFVEGISCQEFIDAVDFAISNYRDNFGGGSNQMISYKDFISIVTSSQTVAKKLRSYEAMYLLDRLVYTRVVLQTLEKKKDKNSSDYSIDSATRDTKRYQHYADVPVSLAYLLTAFSMVIGEETAGDQYERSADQRIKGLFHLGTKLDSNSINGSNTTNTAEDTAFMSRG